MNREVFLSILAMDAYQRGYSPGINGLSTPTFGEDGSATIDVKIGHATITKDSSSLKIDDIRLDIPIGFYALAYEFSGSSDFSNGEAVVSYRGTDFDAANGGPILDSEFIKDLTNGWSSFTGLGSSSQFPLAEAFFKAVTGSGFEIGNTGPVFDNVIVTGHSLGGGLAGLAANDNIAATRLVA